MSQAVLFTCASCGRKNRAPEGSQMDTARCGICKTALFADGPPDVDEATFKKIAAGDTLPVLVDVWAPWCGPCRTMAPAFAKAAETLRGDMRLIKVNADTAPALMQGYGIQGIPTMLLFNGGKLINRISGALPTTQIVAWARDQEM